ncbi:MAG: RDD family protein [Propionibacteriaceae bacterium]|jgi:uncharacterized RDD family membrane protein YckC|nr:RDD family protein [Propionibacteriaceae bacterium]
MTGDEILTGEGVALQVRAASVVARAGAWFLDALATAAVTIGLIVLASWALGDTLDWAEAQALMTALVFLVLILIPATVENLTHGRSLGKLAFGIQILRDDGGPVRFRHCFGRALIGFFELWMTSGGVAFLATLMNDRGKRLGDLLSGTYAASIRGAKSTLLPLYMPQELIGWIRFTDLRPLPEGLALRTRQFLQRAGQFPPPARQRLGLRLAAQVEDYVAPSPPPGTHPERFLAAVLFERRLREQAAADARAPRLNAQLAGVEALPFHIPDPEV